MISPAERRVLDHLDVDGLVGWLSDLVRLPSVSGSAEENEGQHRLARAFDELGATVDLWPLDLEAITADPDFPGMEAPRTEAWGVVGRWGGGDGPTLVLNGHIDVVPVGDRSQWSADPFSGHLVGDAVHGRGTCDMKGGLAAAVFAVRALRDAGVRLRGDVLLQSVVGEEDGGLGTFATIRRGHLGDAAIIPEPTGLDLVPACGGALTFRLRVPGRSAHAAVRTSGVSAIDGFWGIWRALAALEARRNAEVDPLMAGHDIAYALSIGTVRAGEWPSSVPDELVAEGRLGVALGEPVDDARRELEDAVAEACSRDRFLRDHPATVEWFGGQFASGRTRDEALIGLVTGVHESLRGGPPGVWGGPFGSDLRLLAGLGGVPTVHYGPGDVVRAHAPDECVPVAEVVGCAEALALAVLRCCGVR